MPSLLGTGPGVHYKSLKTVNQSLKHKVNRCILSLRLNECKLSASRTAAGRLFHTTGPATEGSIVKLRSVQSRFAETLSLTLTLNPNPNFGESGRHPSFLSVVQCSRCLTLSGDESVPDHCCTHAQNLRGSLGSGVCGL